MGTKVQLGRGATTWSQWAAQLVVRHAASEPPRYRRNGGKVQIRRVLQRVWLSGQHLR